MKRNKKDIQKEILDLLGINNDDDDKKENKYEDQNKSQKAKPVDNYNKIKDLENEKIKLENEKNMIDSEEESLKINFSKFINEDDIPSYDNEEIFEEEEDKTFENFETKEEIERKTAKEGKIENENIIIKFGVNKIEEYRNESGSLNNKNNPFIKAQKPQKEENKDNEIKDDKEEKNTGSIEKSTKINDMNYLLYINDLFIEKENLIEIEDDKNIHVYRKLIYGGKKFYLMTSVKDLKKYKNAYYYCTNHRTSKFSEIYEEKGKKRISICEGKILYEIKTKKYFFANDHSDKCKNIKKIEYENIQSINKEISNYKNFREELINYLNLNPVISFHDFAKEGQSIYDKNNCNFTVSKNTYSNIYYEWRKKSNSFNKFSIYNHKTTKNNKLFLRDYTYKILYGKTGKNTIEHEHIIYVSDFYIKSYVFPHIFI